MGLHSGFKSEWDRAKLVGPSVLKAYGPKAGGAKHEECDANDEETEGKKQFLQWHLRRPQGFGLLSQSRIMLLDPRLSFGADQTSADAPFDQNHKRRREPGLATPSKTLLSKNIWKHIAH